VVYKKGGRLRTDGFGEFCKSGMQVLRARSLESLTKGEVQVEVPMTILLCQGSKDSGLAATGEADE